jgi:hypothetical protein
MFMSDLRVYSMCMYRTEVNYFLFFLHLLFLPVVFIALKNFVISFFSVRDINDLNEQTIKKKSVIILVIMVEL